MKLKYKFDMDLFFLKNTLGMFLYGVHDEVTLSNIVLR